MKHELRLNLSDPRQKPIAYSKLNELRGQWRITFTPDHPRRSDRQNRYYHPCFTLPFMQYLNEQGDDVTKDQAHEMLAMEILGRNVLDPKTGAIVGRVRPSTAKLSTVQFNEFLDKAAQWLAGFSIVVPEPDIYREPLTEKELKNDRLRPEGRRASLAQR